MLLPLKSVLSLKAKAGIGGMIVREFAFIFLLGLGRVEEEINKLPRTLTPKIPTLLKAQ